MSKTQDVLARFGRLGGRGEVPDQQRGLCLAGLGCDAQYLLGDILSDVGLAAVLAHFRRDLGKPHPSFPGISSEEALKQFLSFDLPDIDVAALPDHETIRVTRQATVFDRAQEDTKEESVRKRIAHYPSEVHDVVSRFYAKEVTDIGLRETLSRLHRDNASKRKR